MKNIAIIGFGVVGSGVYEIIKENSKALSQNCGEELCVKRILDIRDFPDHKEKELFTKNFDDLLKDDIDIVVETMGGVRFAYEYSMALLKAGKSIVTSNKELVATHGDELFKIAEKNNVRYMYEASVGGGIPIIRPLACDLAANKITEIAGILNGTTNYILTKMYGENRSFDDALREAQEKGYAEKDPSADVDGLDACRKIAILMSEITHKKLNCDDIYTKGIRNITEEDVAYAAALGYTIKLIALGQIKDKTVFATVQPMLVSKSSMLSGVEDVFNAAMVRGNMSDLLMFYGRGAGKLPTASAVVGDIVDIVRNPSYRPEFSWDDSTDNTVLPYNESKARFFVRIKREQCDKAVWEFGKDKIEIIKGMSDYGFVTPEISVFELNKSIEQIGGSVSIIRMLW